MVPTPIVTASLGTSSMEEKNRALSRRVSSVRAFKRVRLASDEPGSLNAMCPSLPIPAAAGRFRRPLQWPVHTRGHIRNSLWPGQRDMAAFRDDIDLAEEVCMHKVVVRLRVLGRQSNIFIQVKVVACAKLTWPLRTIRSIFGRSPKACCQSPVRALPRGGV